MLTVLPSLCPELDAGFVPAVLWNRAYRALVATDPGARPLTLTLARPDGTVFVHESRVLAAEHPAAALNLRYAERIGLERASFAECLDSARFRDAVEQDMTEGRALGITGTPTFFVNGRRLVGAMPVEAFREAVRAALTEDGK